MLNWFALVALAVIAFGVLGLGLGVLRLTARMRTGLTAICEQIGDLSDSVRSGLSEVAEQFSLIDDDEEEEVSFELPMDEQGYDIDDETDEAFTEIAKGLEDLERRGNKIAKREESGA